MHLSTISVLPTIVSVGLSLLTVHRHFLNYRKPQQQRLIVRILLIIPIYSIGCYTSLAHPLISSFLNPLREIYEAFVIYTFFSLLTDFLDGERNIVVMTSGRAPVSHPWPLRLMFKPVDISDPFDLLNIKRGILQYVWLKPFLCLSLVIAETMNWELLYLWATFGYNVSVSLSLFQLAMFWRCLYGDLKKFNPWGKFLCVKLIIFASYWQGLIISILRHFNLFVTSGDSIQSLLMSFELVGFAIGHYYSFSYTEYLPQVLPGSGRLPYWLALKDPFGTADLKHDFKTVWLGDGYDYRQFDSVEAIIAHPESSSRMKRFNQGFRVSKEKGRYWLKTGTNNSNAIDIQGNSIMDQNTPLLRSESITSKSSIIPIYAKSVISYNLIDSNSNNGNSLLYHQNNYIPTFGEASSKQINDENNNLEDLDIILQEYVSDIKIFEKAKKERPFGDLNSPVVYEGAEHSHSREMERRRREIWSRIEV